MEKQAPEYTKPMIADYGDLEELTAQQSQGNVLDKDFPTGTPVPDLTFSP